MRICKGIVSAKSAVERVRGILPPLGNVRALIITEKQFDNMQILLGSAGFNERMNDDKNLVLFAFDEKIGDYRYLSEYSRDMGDSSGLSDSQDLLDSRDSHNESLANLSSNKTKDKPKKPKEQSLFEF